MTRKLPGSVKLVGAVSLALFGVVVTFVQMVSMKSAATEVLTAAANTTILVHLNEAKTYEEANLFCTAEYGTHLAVIEDSTANQRLWNMVQVYAVPAWIGFADLMNAENFEWVDASADAYTNWDEAEPTDLCVEMLSATGTWKDVHCSETKKAFFCEAAADSSATALVRVNNAEVHNLAVAVTSAEAQTHCQAQGEELYSVQDSADNSRIETALNAAAVDFAWIGLKTAAASYGWVDGRPLDFELWSTGQPLENSFSQMRASDGKWMTACASENVMAVICTTLQSTATTEAPTTATMTPTTVTVPTMPVPTAPTTATITPTIPTMPTAPVPSVPNPTVPTAPVPSVPNPTVPSAPVPTVPTPPSTLRLNGVFPVVRNNSLGYVRVKSKIQISMNLKPKSVAVNGPFGLFQLDAGEPKVNGYGRHPAAFLLDGNKLLIRWGQSVESNVGVCADENDRPTIEANRYTTLLIVAEPGIVKYYIRGVLQCQRDGDWVGHSRDARVWMSTDEFPAADADIQYFDIISWA